MILAAIWSRSSPFLGQSLHWVSVEIHKRNYFKGAPRDNLTPATHGAALPCLLPRLPGTSGSYPAKAPGGLMQPDMQPQRNRYWKECWQIYNGPRWAILSPGRACRPLVPASLVVERGCQERPQRKRTLQFFNLN